VVLPVKANNLSVLDKITVTLSFHNINAFALKVTTTTLFLHYPKDIQNTHNDDAVALQPRPGLGLPFGFHDSLY
jgi:hypothetical protein